MIIKISGIIENCKTKSSLNKVIDGLKSNIKTAYDERRVMDRRDFAQSLRQIDAITNIYTLFKRLRKKSNDYDCKIFISKDGYVNIDFIFPIEQKELDKAWNIREKKVKELGRDGASCVRITEQIWNVCHNRVNNVFKDYTMNDYQSYDKYGDSPLVRCSAVTIC